MVWWRLEFIIETYDIICKQRRIEFSILISTLFDAFKNVITLRHVIVYYKTVIVNGYVPFRK